MTAPKTVSPEIAAMGLLKLNELSSLPFYDNRDGRLLAGIGTADQFIRPIYMSLDLERSGMHLLELLAFCDKSFKVIADDVGATVVRHQWGLLDLEDDRFSDSQDRPLRVPPFNNCNANIALGAVVEVIRSRRPFNEEQLASLSELSLNPQDIDGFYWNDGYFGQFVDGDDSSGESRLWLVDIDMAFQKPLA